MAEWRPFPSGRSMFGTRDRKESFTPSTHWKSLHKLKISFIVCHNLGCLSNSRHLSPGICFVSRRTAKLQTRQQTLKPSFKVVCCQNFLQVKVWSDMSCEERLKWSAQSNNMRNFLFGFVLVVQSLLLYFILVLKKRIPTLYCIVLQLCCTALFVYGRKLLPKTSDDFSRLLRLGTLPPLKTDVLDPFLETSQMLGKKISNFGRAAWEGIEVKSGAFAQGQPGPIESSADDSFVDFKDDSNSSLYVSSREEWESEVDSEKDDGYVNEFSEDTDNPQKRTVTIGNDFSEQNSGECLARDSGVNENEKVSFYNTMKSDLLDHWQNDPTRDFRQSSTVDNLSTTPPSFSNFFVSLMRLFSFFTRDILAPFLQLIFLIFQDMKVRSDTKFLRKQLVYPPVPYKEERIVSFNKSYERILKQVGYFPQFENDSKVSGKEEAKEAVENDVFSKTAPFVSFIEHTWKEWKDRSKNGFIWQNISKKMKDMGLN